MRHVLCRPLRASLRSVRNPSCGCEIPAPAKGWRPWIPFRVDEKSCAYLVAGGNMKGFAERRVGAISLLAIFFLSVSLPAFAEEIPLPELRARMAERYKNTRPKQWGEALPGIVTRLPATFNTASPKVLALTLDTCGGGRKGADQRILQLLRELKIPVTVFATTPWLRSQDKLARELAANPLFELAAHGEKHKPASLSGRSAYGIKGTASPAELVDEVEGNARVLAALAGKRPRWFRSGTAYYDEGAVALIHNLDLEIAGYTVSLDQGATLPAKEVARRALAAKSGSILLCHLNHPESGTAEGLMQALPLLREQGVRFVLLSEVLEKRE